MFSSPRIQENGLPFASQDLSRIITEFHSNNTTFIHPALDLKEINDSRYTTSKNQNSSAFDVRLKEISELDSASKENIDPNIDRRNKETQRIMRLKNLRPIPKPKNTQKDISDNSFASTTQGVEISITAQSPSHALLDRTSTSLLPFARSKYTVLKRGRGVGQSFLSQHFAGRLQPQYLEILEIETVFCHLNF